MAKSQNAPGGPKSANIKAGPPHQASREAEPLLPPLDGASDQVANLGRERAELQNAILQKHLLLLDRKLNLPVWQKHPRWYGALLLALTPLLASGVALSGYVVVGYFQNHLARIELDSKELQRNNGEARKQLDDLRIKQADVAQRVHELDLREVKLKEFLQRNQKHNESLFAIRKAGALAHPTVDGDRVSFAVHFRAGEFDDRATLQNAISHLPGIIDLTFLEFDNVPLNDDDIAVVKEIPLVEVLLIRGGNISDEGLRPLRGLSHLRTLAVESARITDSFVDQLDSYPALRHLSLRKTAITDSAINAIQRLTELESLVLSETQVTGDAIEKLKSLSGLKTIELVDVEITDASVDSLMEIAGLESLTLRRTKVSSQAIARCSRLSQLRRLDLSETNVDDQALVFIQGNARIEELFLRRTKVTNAGIGSIAMLRALRVLDLNETHVTSDGLVHLSGLSSIRYLWLGDTSVGDAGMVHLQALKELKLLELTGTSISSPGLKSIRSLPKLETLELADTKCTDDELAVLHEIPSLRDLILTGTHVTRNGLLSLEKLPNLEFVSASSETVSRRTIRDLGASTPNITFTVLDLRDWPSLELPLLPTDRFHDMQNELE